MFALLTTQFGEDFVIASLILIFGEMLTVYIFKKFNISDLKSLLEYQFNNEMELLEKSQRRRSSKKSKSFKKFGE